ncbi:MAG: response regulator [Pseudomonadota bacterium]
MSNTHSGGAINDDSVKNSCITHPEQQINILIVDDEAAVLYSLKRLFRDPPYQVHTALTGEKALQLLTEINVDVLISDMSMQHMSGEDLLLEVGALYPEIKIIILSGAAEPESIFTLFNQALVYNYVKKPWNDNELKQIVENAAKKRYQEYITKIENTDLQQLHKTNEELRKTLEDQVDHHSSKLLKTQQSLQDAYERMQQSYIGIVKMLSYYSSLSAPTLGNHGERIAKLAVNFAKYIQLDNNAIREIETAAFLHDIGLAIIDNEILSKPYASRTPEEKKQIEQHAILGESTLMSLPAMHSEAKIIRHHHELYNGQGYPDKLIGKNIPLGSRIILLANDYDDMISGTSMDCPLSKTEAVRLIKKFSKLRYDPDYCEDFCQMILTGTNPSSYKNGIIQSLKSEQLTPGMQLHENLLSQSGMLLLTAGHKLSAHSISSIQRMEKSENQYYTFYIDVENPQKIADPFLDGQEIIPDNKQPNEDNQAQLEQQITINKTIDEAPEVDTKKPAAAQVVDDKNQETEILDIETLETKTIDEPKSMDQEQNINANKVIEQSTADTTVQQQSNNSKKSK